jgi:hypothetical protein
MPQPAPHRLVRGPHPRALLQLLLEDGHRPVRMRIAEILRRPAHQRRQESFGPLDQDGRAPAPVAIAEHRGVRFLEEGRGPVGDALPGDPEHVGDLGGGPTAVEFEHGQGPPVGASVSCLIELLTKLTSLPMLQFESAHLGLL